MSGYISEYVIVQVVGLSASDISRAAGPSGVYTFLKFLITGSNLESSSVVMAFSIISVNPIVNARLTLSK